MSNTPLLQINNLNFSFGKTKVLSNISFEIKKQDFLAILGPNGSGKTTLLKLILGLYTSQTKSIKLFDENIKNFTKWEKIGYVPQKVTNFEKDFPASVREIVSMGMLSHKKFPKLLNSSEKLKVEESLKIVGMEKYIERRIGELSGGQQQRIFIARALCTSPEILFLDEPTTGVDQKTQDTFYNLLGDLNEKGMTIILVSHDIGRITKYVNKIASLNQTLEFYGSHKEFCAWDKEHDHNTKHHKICIH